MNVKSPFSKLLNATRVASAQMKQGVGDLRDKRLAILDEIDRIESLPALRSDVIAAIDRGLDRMIAEGQDAVYTPGLVRNSGGAVFEPPRTEAVMGLLVGANRAAFREQLIALIDQSYTQPEMPLEDRARELKRLRTDLHDVEMAEEALIREAERVGNPILRRRDTDGDILLRADSEFA
ncbi:hypothetical protein [Paracoccus sp. SCSIO 75233]|uniref:hypothetical protein n=1 Tax=Paracoccus sp. SCSIO 75233 TaxID=3017782 RepID=UPI0022F074D3|nr:hypothetical protein [Paracoccus sp. SCSIO 75233]WBU51886.1 hypothetical protein PAF12_08490 [Paracoccus sp. SCSIO 75233]